MKKIYFLALAIIALAAIESCATTTNPTPTPSVVGFWSGNYDVTNGYAMLFRSNGTVRVFNDTDTTAAGKAEGTYTVSDSVRTHYTYLLTPFDSYSTAGKVNSAFTTMTGTYGTDLSTAGYGIFSLTK